MSFFDRIKHKLPVKGSNSNGRKGGQNEVMPDIQDEDGMPDMELSAEGEPAPLGALLNRASQRFPDGKTGRQPQADAQASRFDESDGVPSVNRRRATSRAVQALVVACTLGIGGAMIYAVQSGDSKPDKAALEAKKQRGDAMVSNTLPKIDLTPSAPPEVSAASAPSLLAGSTGEVQAQPMMMNTAAGGQPVAQMERIPDWTDRKRGGNLLVSNSGASMAPSTGQGAPGAATDAYQPQAGMQPASLRPGEAGGTGQGSSDTSMAARLEPTPIKAVAATVLPHRHMLITQGSMLDCVLDTALDSNVPGMTVCHLTRDVYSTDGRVLLLDRGSKLVGEYQSGMKQGQTRIFVLWSRAETPNGVVVSLNSPGTDALGRSGLDGAVDNHFWQRFGSAILMSLVDDAVAAASRSGGSGTNNYYGNTASAMGKVVEKMLDSTANMPPTLVKNQGEHIQVMVARDLDFSKVYDLRETQ